jgi:hypothetical protein
MSPVEFWPQSASVADIEQSEAARAKDTDIKLGTPTISATVVTLDNRIVAPCHAIHFINPAAVANGYEDTLSCQTLQ